MEAAHLQAELGIQVGQRLVHQEEPRPDDDGARDRGSLLLATGELPRQLARVVGQPDHVERLVDAASQLILWQTPDGKAERDVAANGHMRK
jgi:hypothetical protein